MATARTTPGEEKGPGGISWDCPGGEFRTRRARELLGWWKGWQEEFTQENSSRRNSCRRNSPRRIHPGEFIQENSFRIHPGKFIQEEFMQENSSRRNSPRKIHPGGIHPGEFIQNSSRRIHPGEFIQENSFRIHPGELIQEEFIQENSFRIHPGKFVQEELMQENSCRRNSPRRIHPGEFIQNSPRKNHPGGIHAGEFIQNSSRRIHSEFIQENSCRRNSSRRNSCRRNSSRRNSCRRIHAGGIHPGEFIQNSSRRNSSRRIHPGEFIQNSSRRIHPGGIHAGGIHAGGIHAGGIHAGGWDGAWKRGESPKESYLLLSSLFLPLSSLFFTPFEPLFTPAEPIWGRFLIPASPSSSLVAGRACPSSLWVRAASAAPEPPVPSWALPRAVRRVPGCPTLALSPLLPPCPFPAARRSERGQGTEGHFGMALEGWDKDTNLVYPGGEERKCAGRPRRSRELGKEGAAGHLWTRWGGFDLKNKTKQNKTKKTPQTKPLCFLQRSCF
ncbi:uncharacterized protein LOC120762947 [Hirundo rustica]|uniref:uncharacterized protein LOC120762947 n=1 Tax=Hirundo rustica TaxID=43150 RepID=UPI001A940EA4|nr:uncharacterized protein LOC120762947 [Hirundo rustica]